MKRLLYILSLLFSLTTSAQVTVKSGDSFTALLVFDSTYTMSRIKDISVYIGSREVARKSTGGVVSTSKAWAFRVPVSSKITRAYTQKANFEVAVWDSLLGVRRAAPVVVNFVNNDNSFTNTATNTGTDLTLYIQISSGGVTATSYVATVLKGDKGDAGTSVDTTLYLRKTAAVAAYVAKEAGKGLSANDYTTTEKSKLAGVATGATANSTDAQLRDRSTHTGTQAQSTITGLTASLDSKSDYVEVSTYASLIALSTPLVSTLYKVANDENKGILNSFYLWWPTGKRLWVAATEDN